MAKSLIEELPKIIKRGKREAKKILEGISDNSRLTLQTNELVLPSKDKTGYFKDEVKNISENQWFNKLIYGDNLLTMQALLVGDESTPSMRNKFDLIYIDPPFDSKADYRTKVQLPGEDIEQRPNVIEQFAYADTWKKGTVSYLEMMVPRLILMKELLSETGSIYVHIDWHVGHYVKVIMDEIFGKNNFRNEIIWKYTGSLQPKNDFARKHDVIFRYSKSNSVKYNPVYIPYSKGAIARFDHEDEKGRYKITKRNGKEYKTYMKEGKPIEDVWIEDDIVDIPIIMKNSKENVNYGTQKPETLLERIIKASTDE